MCLPARCPSSAEASETFHDIGLGWGLGLRVWDLGLGLFLGRGRGPGKTILEEVRYHLGHPMYPFTRYYTCPTPPSIPTCKPRTSYESF